MERILETIERMRQLPEPVRRQILWAGVFGVSVVVAIAWFLTLRVQVRVPELTAPAESTEEPGIALPSIGQTLSIRSASLKPLLRQLILGDEPPETEAPDAPDRSRSAPEVSVPRDEVVPRLPSR